MFIRREIAKDEKNIKWLNSINVLACFAVIVLHCNSIFWSHPIDDIWKSANIIEVMFYWAVPFFFMQTGTTLLDYKIRYSTRDYFIKRLWRVIIPFGFWGIFSYFYKVICCHWEIEPLNMVINGLLSSKYIYAYWFFWPLLLVYLTIPILSLALSVVEEQTKKRLIKYIIGIQIVLVSILPLLSDLYVFQIPKSFINPVFNEYMLFVSLGYYISHYEIEKRHRYWIYFLGFLGLLIHLKGTEKYSLLIGQVYSVYKGYTNLPSVLQSTSLFLLFKQINWEKPNMIDRVVAFLSRYSFGIYLIHMYVLEQIQIKFCIDPTSMIWRLIGPIIIYTFSLSICMLMDRKKISRMLIGLS